MKNANEENKSIKIIFNVLKILIILILVPIIFFNVVIIVDTITHPNEVPSFFGWKPFIVMSGSMEAEIFAGDVAIIKEVDTNTLQIGDIIAFKESKDFIVTHRITDVTYNENGEKEFITKGDNNNEVDRNSVSLSQIEGKYITKISKMGHLLLFIQKPVGTVISVCIPIIILLILHTVENKKNSKYIKNEETENEILRQELEKLKKQNEQLSKEKDETK